MPRSLYIAATLLATLTATAPAGRLVAQASARAPGSELTVFLATVGPGDQVWEKFGHNAIWIRDALTGTTIAYNYGIFDFNQDRFIPRLMKGSMLYSMGVSEASAELYGYSYFNRTVTLQELRLTPVQRHALREFLEWNWLPQNRDYLYDYFRDNCSTRVRDALDRALGGVLRASLAGVPTGTTFRSHSLRLTAGSPATYTGLMLGLGLPTDEPIDAWEESFIPMELARHLRSIRVVDADGDSVPLVIEESVAFQADRPAEAEQAPNRLAIYLVLGLLLAGGLFLLARAARTRHFARAALAMTLFFWGLVTGCFGVILTLLWLFTNHTAAYPNLNLLQVNPLGLLLAAAAPFAVIASARSRVARLAWPTAIALLALSALGIVLHAFSPLRQANWPLIALLLPIHLAVLASLWHVQARDPSPAVDTAGALPARAAA